MKPKPFDIHKVKEYNVSMNKEFPLGISSLSSNSVFKARFIGIGVYFKSFIDSLVVDYNEPKFGYSGELWDEEDKE